MTDAELLESYRATRDRAVLDGLFARHYPTVYHVVLKMVRNATDANDVTQNAFLKALEAADAARPGGSLRNWLLAIAVNEVRQFRRSAARRTRPEHLHEIARKGEPLRGQEGELQRREFEEHLEQALQHFPDELKEPLVLHYYQKLSYSEMAEVLAIPRSTVQFRMDQALQKLREQFKKRGVLSLFAPFPPSRPVSLGLTAMKLKILATSLVLLCCLFPFGALVLKAGRAARPESPGKEVSATPKTTPPAASAATGSVSDGETIFGRVLEKGTDAPIPGALVAVYNVEESTTDQTLTDEHGSFRFASTRGSRAAHQLKITARGFAALSSPSLAASAAPRTYHLSPGGTIAGRVEDLRGLPVFPYRIVIVRDRFEGGRYDEVRSLYQLALPEQWVLDEAEASYHADGRFELRCVATGQMTLLVVMEGAQPFATSSSDEWPVKVEEGKTTEVRIVRPDRGTLRVRVIDSDTRAPISGARVAPFSNIGRHAFDLGVTPSATDSDGICSLPVALQPERANIGSVYALVSKPGYSSRNISLGGQDNGFLEEVVLGKTARLHGRVQSPDGSPVERAAIYVVRAVYEHVAARVFTDARGEYEVPALDAPESYVVQLFDRSLENSRAVTPISLREGEDRNLDFGAEGQASIRGTVTRKGTPLRAVGVCLDPEPRLGSRLLIYTNDRGEFRFEPLASGTYDLSTNLGEQFRVTRRITVREKEATEIRLDTGTLRIRGKALISGRPPDDWESLEVVARRVGADPHETVKAYLRDEADFDLSVPQPGIYQLTICDNYEYVGGDPVLVDLTGRCEVDDVRVSFLRNGKDGRIRLRLVDAATGEPIPDGSYHYTVGNVRGHGGVDQGLIEADDADRVRYQYVVGGDEHVSMPIEVDLSSRSRDERTIPLQRADAVKVSEVYPSSPAEKAGIQEGDLVVAYGGQPVSNLRMLQERSRQGVASQKVPLQILRGAETRILFVPGGELRIGGENAMRNR